MNCASILDTLLNHVPVMGEGGSLSSPGSLCSPPPGNNESEECSERNEPNSTHKAEVFKVDSIRPHGNADRLEIIDVDGYQTIVKKGDFQLGDLAVFIPPDNLVDVKVEPFSFLLPRTRADGKCRIKAMKLRGELSFGLVIHAPKVGSDGFPISEGDNVAGLLGVEHYDPDVHRIGRKGGGITGGESTTGPNLFFVKYDLESGRKYGKKVFEEGEPVFVVEKVHGQNSRYVYHDGKMYCGSRTEWKKEFPEFSHITRGFLQSEGLSEERIEEVLNRLEKESGKRNHLWGILDTHPGLKKFCEANPGVIVYGEVYGAVQDLNYGVTPGEVRFAAFDMLYNGKWFDYEDFLILCDKYDIPVVPTYHPVDMIFDNANKAPGQLGRLLTYSDMKEAGMEVFRPIPFNFEEICKMAEDKSMLALSHGANQICEGVVVRSWKERTNPTRGVGRAVLKWVGCGYLERD